ncbi:MAG: carotenoid biosynthesis protein [Limisphaerales bacterium]
MKAWFHWLFTVLLAAAFALVLAANGLSLDLPGRPGWPEALLILLATVSTITAVARQLPLQNVLLATFVIALMGGAVHALGVTMGIPFGPFLFGAEAGPQFFKTLPWAMPLIWVAAILNSRGVVRLILRPWRKIRSYGFWLIGLTAVLTMLFDLTFDPFASRVKHYWLWMPTKFPLTWQGAPLVNFLSWAVVSLLMLVFVTPALINKSPARRAPDFHPLAVWLGAILLFGIASALHGMWLAVAVDGIIAVLAATFAIRGGQW